MCMHADFINYLLCQKIWFCLTIWEQTHEARHTSINHNLKIERKTKLISSCNNKRASIYNKRELNDKAGHIQFQNREWIISWCWPFWKIQRLGRNNLFTHYTNGKMLRCHKGLYVKKEKIYGCTEEDEVKDSSRNISFSSIFNSGTKGWSTFWFNVILVLLSPQNFW